LHLPSEVATALAAIEAGAVVEDLESETLDFKEDPTTRGAHGQRVAGTDRDDGAARLIADAASCLSNHEGGCVVIGLDDKSSGVNAFRGSGLDAAWLRRRIRELTSPALVVAVAVIEHVGARLLVVEVPRNESSEPYAVSMSSRGGQRRARRVGTTCEEMTSVAAMLEWARARSGYDWSAHPSGRPAGDARPAALDALRDLLRESGEPDRVTLADSDDQDLLGRLQLLRSDGRLTRAGELLLCPGRGPRIVYSARPALGAKSDVSVSHGGRGLLEELAAVLDAFSARNPSIALPLAGLVEGTVSALPFGVVRECLVNGIMHRDWDRPDPITVDHADDELVVHSPGEFVEGIDASTVLTAPSRTRNPHLGAVLRSLRVAEREGTGVDRMYIELVRLGHAPPSFAERDGGVRVAMHGGAPVTSVLRVHAALPARLRASARTAVVIHLLRSRPSVTATELSQAAQERPDELEGFLADAVGAGLLQKTAAPRPGGVPAWRLADEPRTALGRVLPYFSRPAEESVRLIADLARSQGEIRNQDVQDLLGVTSARASQLLKRAEADGVIALGPSAKPTGRGTHYVPAVA